MKGSGVENSVTGSQTHNSPAATTPRPPSRKRPTPSNIPSATTATTTPTSVQSSADDKDDKDWVETPPRKRPAQKQENRETPK